MKMKAMFIENMGMITLSNSISGVYIITAAITIY